MVWRVPEDTDPCPDPSITHDNIPDSLASLTSTQSPASVSLDLGSAPGSGVALDSHSDSGSETETVGLSSKSQSDLEAIEVTEDPVAWSAEVEEMLNNPPPGKFESFNLSGDPSMSSWVFPASDTTEAQNTLRGRKKSISPVNEIDEAAPNRPSHSPSPFFSSSIEPLEDFTGHLAGEGQT